VFKGRQFDEDAFHELIIRKLRINVTEIFICLIALLALGERRLGRALARGFAFGVARTLPMLIGFALVRGRNLTDALAAFCRRS